MAKHGKKPLVLVAEDDPAIRQLLGALVGSCGCSAVFANDGEEALTHWRNMDFDVILMDIRMPFVNGCTAAQQIRFEERREGRTRVPVIGLTAAPNDLDLCELDVVVMKPFKAHAICDLVRKFCGEGEDGEGGSNKS